MSGTTKKVLIGAGLAAGAALAAYLLTSPKDRKKAALAVKNWMSDMKKEVASRVKSAKDLTQQKYESIVDEVAPKYETLKDVSANEVKSFSKELKAHWGNLLKATSKIKRAKKASKSKK